MELTGTDQLSDRLGTVGGRLTIESEPGRVRKCEPRSRCRTIREWNPPPRRIERRPECVLLGMPLQWPQPSDGSAPEADAVSSELQARAPGQAHIDLRLLVRRLVGICPKHGHVGRNARRALPGSAWTCDPAIRERTAGPHGMLSRNRDAVAAVADGPDNRGCSRDHHQHPRKPQEQILSGHSWRGGWRRAASTCSSVPPLSCRVDGSSLTRTPQPSGGARRFVT
jgi:hypothetical protein